MASQQAGSYSVGDRVYALYSAFGTSYPQGTIVRIDHRFNQYEVRFDIGKTMTLFASEIAEQPRSTDINSPVPSNDMESTVSLKLKSPPPDSNLSETMTNEQYHDLITSHRNSHKSKASNRWNMSTFKRLERANPSLCDRVFTADPKQTSKLIVDRIQSASKQKNEDLRYVHALKYVKTDDFDIVNDRGERKVDVFSKYGSRCTISMDLDFDKLVRGNDKFHGEINGELASILDVDPSMIRIESVLKGSITVTFAVIICVSTAVAMSAAIGTGVAVGQRIRERTRNRRPRRRISRSEAMAESRSHSAIIDVIPGDMITVDHDNTPYDAKVVGTFDNLEGHFVEVEYIGDTKPFWWFKTRETLPMNSPRLHFVGPVEEVIDEESIQSMELGGSLLENEVKNKNTGSMTKPYYEFLGQSIVESTLERKNEYSSDMKE